MESVYSTLFLDVLKLRNFLRLVKNAANGRCLCGYVYSSPFRRVSVGGSTHEQGVVGIGGLVGYDRQGKYQFCGNVSDFCKANFSGAINDHDIYNYIGGIIGKSDGDTQIESSYSNAGLFEIGLLRKTTSRIGGIVGSVYFDSGCGHIYNSYSSCDRIHIIEGNSVVYGGVVGTGGNENSTACKACFSPSDVECLADVQSIELNRDGFDGSTSFSKHDMKSPRFLNELNLYPSLNGLDYKWIFAPWSYFPVPGNEIDRLSLKDVEFEDCFGGYHFVADDDSEKIQIYIKPLPEKAKFNYDRDAFLEDYGISPSVKLLSTGKLRCTWYQKYEEGEYYFTYKDKTTAVTKKAKFELHHKNQAGVPEMQYRDICVGETAMIYPEGLTHNSLLDMSDVRVDDSAILSLLPYKAGDYTSGFKVTGLKEGVGVVSFHDNFSNSDGQYRITVKADDSGVYQVFSGGIEVSSGPGFIAFSEECGVEIYLSLIHI